MRLPAYACLIFSVGLSPLAWADLAPEGATISERVSRIEQMLTSEGAQDWALRSSEMQEEIQELRGLIEVTQHQLTQLEEKQQNFEKEINGRLERLEKELAAKNTIVPVAAEPTTTKAQDPAKTAPIGDPPGGPSDDPPSEPSNTLSAPTTTVAPASPTLPDEKPEQTLASPTLQDEEQDQALESAARSAELYDAGLLLLKEKQYAAAALKFSEYINQYPDDPEIPAAYYWLGEADLIQNKIMAAEAAFNTVIKRYPTHPKAADALFKIGDIYQSAGRINDARQIFLRVQTDYPGTLAAKQAGTRLSQLKAE